PARRRAARAAAVGRRRGRPGRWRRALGGAGRPRQRLRPRRLRPRGSGAAPPGAVPGGLRLGRLAARQGGGRGPARGHPRREGRHLREPGVAGAALQRRLPRPVPGAQHGRRSVRPALALRSAVGRAHGGQGVRPDRRRGTGLRRAALELPPGHGRQPARPRRSPAAERDGRRIRPGGDVMAPSLVATAVNIAVMLGFLLTVVPVMVWVERRGSALIQDRPGPNRLGPFGLIQPLADALKFMFKEDVTPNAADKPLYLLAPALAIMPAMLTISVIPFGPDLT